MSTEEFPEEDFLPVEDLTENEIKNFGEYYFPFSELMKYDEFIIHSSYYNDEFLPSVEYVKVGKYSFQNMITNEIHEVKEDMVHRLKVALRPNSPELAYL